VLLALFQGLGIAIALESQAGLVLDPGPMFRFVTVLTLLTGTMFLMWLGEQITERGLATAFRSSSSPVSPPACRARSADLFELVRTGPMHPFSASVHLCLGGAGHRFRGVCRKAASARFW
jgi:preprotein translocase subunit SecY